MSAILNQLLQNMAGSAIDAGLEEVGDQGRRRPVQVVSFVLLLLLSAGIAVASALLWTSAHHPGVAGLWQYVRAGGPWWVLAAPLCAALTVIWLLVPIAGRSSPAAAFSAGTFGFTIAALATFQGGGSGAMNGAAIASGVASLLCPILGLLLALYDAPPLDSPLARVALAYWGRLGHLRALRAWGVRHGWRVREPGAGTRGCP